MASVVDKETIIGTNIAETEDGYTDTAVFYVTGLDESGPSKKLQAMTTTGVPTIGDPHPFIGGIVARSKSAKMDKGGFSAFVTVNYAVPAEEDSGGGGGGGPDGSGGTPGTVRLGSVYERVPSNYATNLDGSRGEAIKLGINLDEPFNLEGGGGSYSQAEDLNAVNTQVGEVVAYVPRLTVIVRGNTAKCPISKALKTGFTNADNFLQPIAGLFDAPPDGTADTWLLIRSGSNSTDNNASFDFEFEWAYNPATWHQVAVFIDPRSGRPPGNVTAPPDMMPGSRGNGTLVVRVAGQATFTPYVTLT